MQILPYSKDKPAQQHQNAVPKSLKNCRNQAIASSSRKSRDIVHLENDFQNSRKRQFVHQQLDSLPRICQPLTGETKEFISKAVKKHFQGKEAYGAIKPVHKSCYQKEDWCEEEVESEKLDADLKEKSWRKVKCDAFRGAQVILNLEEKYERETLKGNSTGKYIPEWLFHVKFSPPPQQETVLMMSDSDPDLHVHPQAKFSPPPQQETVLMMSGSDLDLHVRPQAAQRDSGYPPSNPTTERPKDERGKEQSSHDDYDKFLKNYVQSSDDAQDQCRPLNQAGAVSRESLLQNQDNSSVNGGTDDPDETELLQIRHQMHMDYSTCTEDKQFIQLWSTIPQLALHSAPPGTIHQSDDIATYQHRFPVAGMTASLQHMPPAARDQVQSRDGVAVREDKLVMGPHSGPPQARHQSEQRILMHGYRGQSEGDMIGSLQPPPLEASGQSDVGLHGDEYIGHPIAAVQLAPLEANGQSEVGIHVDEYIMGHPMAAVQPAPLDISDQSDQSDQSEVGIHVDEYIVNPMAAVQPAPLEASDQSGDTRVVLDFINIHGQRPRNQVIRHEVNQCQEHQERYDVNVIINESNFSNSDELVNRDDEATSAAPSDGQVVSHDGPIPDPGPIDDPSQQHGYMLEACHRHELLNQCTRGIVGGDRHLALQFLEKVMEGTLQSPHCGVLTCEKLQRAITGQRLSHHVVRQIGQGGYATVYLCEAVICIGSHLECFQFVRKSLPIRNRNGTRNFQEQEARVYLEHEQTLPWLLEFLGIVRQENDVHLYLQYAPGGSLSDWISRFRRPASVLDAISRDVMFRQICDITYRLACCVSDFNSQGLLHWDIKAWNVLFLSEDCGGRSAVLSDTGSTKVWEDIARGKKINYNDGTSLFCAPEFEEVCALPTFLEMVLCDAWGLGATLYHLLTGRPLWIEKLRELLQLNRSNRHRTTVTRHYIATEGWRVCELIDDIDQSQHVLAAPLVHLLSRCLEYDACMRITPEEARDSPMFYDNQRRQIPDTIGEVVSSCESPNAPNHPTGHAWRNELIRRYPENPYARLSVFYGSSTCIYTKNFRKTNGFHVYQLGAMDDFQKQLKLHVPDHEQGYSLLMYKPVNGCCVLVNAGTVYTSTNVYVKLTDIPQHSQ